MSIIERAKVELEAVNFGAEDSEAMLEILRRFFAQWDSGGAVSVAAPVLQRLIAGKPLGPLTGEDHEWVHVAEQNGGPLYQNIRCSTVFKDPDRAWDIDIPATDGAWTSITFPYWPGRAEVPPPVVEVEVP